MMTTRMEWNGMEWNEWVDGHGRMNLIWKGGRTQRKTHKQADGCVFLFSFSHAILFFGPVIFPPLLSLYLFADRPREDRLGRDALS